MRVAIITENFLPKVDGVTRTLAMLLEHLQRQGHEALVLGPSGAPSHYAGAPVVAAPGVPLPLYPELRLLFPLPRFEQRLAAFRPDVVHVVEPMLLGAAGILWARRLGVPLVSSYHTELAAYCAAYRLGALERPTWAYRRWLHGRCAVTLAPSRTTALQLLRRGFPRVGVWSRGVDSTLFTPARRSDAWRVRVAGPEALAARKIVLYVGRLSPEKGLDTLVAAFRALGQSLHTAGTACAHLVLVGDGPSRGELERALADQPATFTGYLRGEALAEAYASADVFAFPSATETFGQVVLEAMASALPVVACGAGGVRDLVRHGETGLLTPPGDTPAFAAALRAALCPERPTAGDELRARLGARARAAATGRTWEAAMDGLLGIYAQVIEARGLRRQAVEPAAPRHRAAEVA